MYSIKFCAKLKLVDTYCGLKKVSDICELFAYYLEEKYSVLKMCNVALSSATLSLIVAVSLYTCVCCSCWLIAWK